MISMLKNLVFAFILSVLAASPISAGAWLRDKGRSFVATTGEFINPSEIDGSAQNFTFYAEHGLGQRLTLGVDLGGDTLEMDKVIGFFRWPLSAPQRSLKVAFELGAGQVDREYAIRPGLSIGRGIMFFGNNGWLGLDSRMVIFKGGGLTLENDLTLGLATTRKTKVIFQLQTGNPESGASYSKLVPSFVIEVRPGQHIEIGLSEPLSPGSERRSLKLGFWRHF